MKKHRLLLLLVSIVVSLNAFAEKAALNITIDQSIGGGCLSGASFVCRASSGMQTNFYTGSDCSGPIGNLAGQTSTMQFEVPAGETSNYYISAAGLYAMAIAPASGGLIGGAGIAPQDMPSVHSAFVFPIGDTGAMFEGFPQCITIDCSQNDECVGNSEAQATVCLNNDGLEC